MTVRTPLVNDEDLAVAYLLVSSMGIGEDWEKQSARMINMRGGRHQTYGGRGKDALLLRGCGGNGRRRGRSGLGCLY